MRLNRYNVKRSSLDFFAFFVDFFAGPGVKHEMKRGIFTALLFLFAAAPALCGQANSAKNAALLQATAQLSAAVDAHPSIPVRPIGTPAQKLTVAGIPNAGQISGALFRGAQPSAQGLAELKKIGVTTIVDLRGNAGEVRWERQQAESLGLHFVNIPILGWSSPTDSQVAQFLKLFDDPNQKIFVHCRYGQDRTGVMVAAYRIAAQNWTADQALLEMNSFGFHYHLYPWMRSYVRKFPTSYASQGAFANLRTAPAPAN